ncbi:MULTISPECIES: polysaccharide biosynthesis/export family protein [unclassified Novosphingobium]|uniref:polysaccharide biosynthesis/export family protein n=1 Tax=unclassified Novosphingobium TaxID=2644732 RepID=UPI00135CA9F1|nr:MULTISPECIES: polysaccharide biosynthesis/export family protein [unclassified Novosphingobium]
MHNSKSFFMLGVLLAGSALAGCSTVSKNPDLPVGNAAYDVVPATIPVPTAYAIVPKDKLAVRVFGEPDISSDELMVDEVGFIQVPLIGTVKAAGRSAPDVSTEITARLRERYIVDPQVAVSVKEFALRFVSVEGEVKKPGVYEIDGRATLLSAIARAESPEPTAKLDEIVLFRTINGERMAARFNLKDIRSGLAPDPMIVDGDVVMVGYSGIKGLWQDVLRAAPIFNAFVVLARNNN